MATTVLSAALLGVQAIPVEVEVDLLRRLPAVSIVGLPASAVRESAERVRSALQAAELEFPRKRVVINLAPADLKKEGTALDLPIALGILVADGQLPENAVAGILAAGELSLDGRLRSVRGALSLAVAAAEMGRILVVPRVNAEQAAMVPGVEVWAADTLEEVVRWLRSESDPRVAEHLQADVDETEMDLRDVRGQHAARRALEVAAAGAHHLLMLGPPGCGKSMLAQRLPSILPPLSFTEALSITQIRSAAGLATPHVSSRRPFRAPHHTVTVAGLVGDARLRPGEIPLAHRGVLFLDEAPEFRRSVLEVLRQPLETGELIVTRAKGTATFPAELTLVLAANPCPCGNLGSPHPCICSMAAIGTYRRKLSGPLLDRVDLHVELAPVAPDDLLHGDPGEPSEAVRERVFRARERQFARGQAHPNGRLRDADLDRFAPLTEDARTLLRDASQAHALSARSTRRIHKVARTLADLRGATVIDLPDIAEAASFRPL